MNNGPLKVYTSVNYVETERLTLPHSGFTDTFLIKFDVSGNISSHARISGAGYDSPAYLTLDRSGHVYIAGSSTSTPLGLYATTNGVETQLASLSNIGSFDIFMAKFAL